MFYAVLIVAALGWLAAGALYAGNAIGRQKLSDAYMQINDLGQKNVRLEEVVYNLEEDLFCTQESLAYETGLSTRMMDERDNALKCLELVINEASTEELTK